MAYFIKIVVRIHIQAIPHILRLFFVKVQQIIKLKICFWKHLLDSACTLRKHIQGNDIILPIVIEISYIDSHRAETLMFEVRSNIVLKSSIFLVNKRRTTGYKIIGNKNIIPAILIDIKDISRKRKSIVQQSTFLGYILKMLTINILK